MEHAVLLSLKKKDDAAMERAFTQVKNFYADTRYAGRANACNDCAQSVVEQQMLT